MTEHWFEFGLTAWLYPDGTWRLEQPPWTVPVGNYVVTAVDHVRGSVTLRYAGAD